MKKIFGLKALLAERHNFPKSSWIFIENRSDINSIDALLVAGFSIPENEDDEFYGEDNLVTWLEVATFLDVIELREKNMKNPTPEAIANAAIYYIENDDFLE
jgi:hypothetical protein